MYIHYLFAPPERPLISGAPAKSSVVRTRTIEVVEKYPSPPYDLPCQVRTAQVKLELLWRYVVFARYRRFQVRRSSIETDIGADLKKIGLGWPKSENATCLSDGGVSNLGRSLIFLNKTNGKSF